jgi:hypothetical protein
MKAETEATIRPAARLSITLVPKDCIQESDLHASRTRTSCPVAVVTATSAIGRRGKSDNRFRHGNSCNAAKRVVALHQIIAN